MFLICRSYKPLLWNASGGPNSHCISHSSILHCNFLEAYFTFKAALISRGRWLFASTKFVPLFAPRNLVQNPVEHKPLEDIKKVEAVRLTVF